MTYHEKQIAILREMAEHLLDNKRRRALEYAIMVLESMRHCPLMEEN